MTKVRSGGNRGGLARYVAAATLARSADGGAVLAIVLLVTADGGPGWLAGLLGASITAPHLIGPFVARTLDVARDGRTVLTLACLIHGSTLAAAVLAYPHVHPGVTAVLLMVSGLFGPLLTGGISSRLPAISGPDRATQRRAQGWDIATYGIAGTLSPALVASVSAVASPTAAALILAGATFAAAALVRLLPYASPVSDTHQVPHATRTLQLMLRTGPLRRTLYLTVAVALSVAALPIAAVTATRTLGVEPAAAGILTAAYGLGGLAASIAIMVRPLAGEADRSMTRFGLAVAASLTAVLASRSFDIAVAAYALTGILNSYFFAATLAARTDHAPAVARGQVFVWTGALKITAGSAGTALAGATITTTPHLPIIVAIGVTLTACLSSQLERARRH